MGETEYFHDGEPKGLRKSFNGVFNLSRFYYLHIAIEAIRKMMEILASPSR